MLIECVKIVNNVNILMMNDARMNLNHWNETSKPGQVK